MNKIIAIVLLVTFALSIFPFALAGSGEPVATMASVSYLQIIRADFTPEIGQRPTDSLDLLYTVSDGDLYITQNAWHDEMTGSADFERFEAGRSYYREIVFTAKDTTTFAQSVEVKVGTTANDYIRSAATSQDGKTLSVTTKAFEAVEGEALSVDRIKIMNADVIPAEGANPGELLRYELDPMANYTCTEHYWYNVTDGEEATSFEAGKEYALCFRFEIMHGYKFAENVFFNVNDNGEGTEVDLAKTQINDSAVTLWLKAIKPVEQAKIHEALIVDADITPVAGDKASDHYAFSVPKNACYTAEVIGWYNDNDHTYLKDNDVFKEGVPYSIGYRLTANTGYRFEDPVGKAINGDMDIVDDQYSDYFDEDGKVFDLWTLPVYALAEGTIMLDSIEITGVSLPPVAGEITGNFMSYTLPENAPYSVVDVAWTKDYESALAYTDVFEEGQIYAIGFLIAANEGYAFKRDFEITVNGMASVISTDNTRLMDYDTCAVLTNLFKAQPAQSSPVMKGDLNGDNLVNTGDAVAVLRYAVKLLELDDKFVKAGDVNNDGSLNTADAVTILRFSAGLISEF